MSVDIEKIVDETVKTEEATVEEEKDVKQEQEDSTTGDTSTTETDDETEKLRKENERLRKANKTLNSKVRQPKQEVQEETRTEEVQQDAADPLATREGWMNEIDRRAKQVVAPILESNFRRATNRFIEVHPEYAADKQKLASILSAAKQSGAVDEEAIFESMGQAWASANWRDLQTAHAKKSESRSRAQAAALGAAGGSEGSQVDTTEYTEQDRAEAERLGKPIDKYMKAKRRLEASSINL